jgi:hypothetical protein
MERKGRRGPSPRSQTQLVSLAGLDGSSRLLTSKTANPTTDNAFRPMVAMGIKLEAILPTGERIQLVEPERATSASRLAPAT